MLKPQNKIYDTSLLLPEDLGKHIKVAKDRGGHLVWQPYAYMREFQKESLNLIYGKESNKLIVTVSVRFGKSLFFSVLLPFWYLIKFPSNKVLLCSNQKKLTTRNARNLKNLIEEFGPLYGIHPDKNQWAVECFRTMEGGEVNSFSAEATIRGFDADLLVFDDLVKNQAKALSADRADSLASWFEGEALTRTRSEESKIILVGSRSAPDDPQGRCLAKNPELEPTERWRHINYPALFSKNDQGVMYADDDGQSLEPRLYSTKKLKQKQRNLKAGPDCWQWSCMFQQDAYGDPRLLTWPDQSLFDNILFEHDDVRYQLACQHNQFYLLSQDPAKGSLRRENINLDYCATLYAMVDQNEHIWVIRPLMKRLNSVSQVSDLFLEQLSNHPVDAGIIETSFFQQSVYERVKEQMHPRHRNIPILPYEPSTKISKEMRCSEVLTDILEKKQLHILNCHDGVEVLSQLRAFGPKCRNDDGVDASAMLVVLRNMMLDGQVDMKAQDPLMGAVFQPDIY